jgi:hypothetical protein
MAFPEAGPKPFSKLNLHSKNASIEFIGTPEDGPGIRARLRNAD